MCLFPDASDVPGYRLMIIANRGTGRGDATTCDGMKVNEVHLFPGLLNSIKGTQEMDKMYGAVKGVSTASVMGCLTLVAKLLLQTVMERRQD